MSFDLLGFPNRRIKRLMNLRSPQPSSSICTFPGVTPNNLKRRQTWQGQLYVHVMGSQGPVCMHAEGKQRASSLQTFCDGVLFAGQISTHLSKNNCKASKFNAAQGKLGTPVFSHDIHTNKRLSTRTCRRMDSACSHCLASPSKLTCGIAPGVCACPLRFRPIAS